MAQANTLKLEEVHQLLTPQLQPAMPAREALALLRSCLERCNASAPALAPHNTHSWCTALENAAAMAPVTVDVVLWVSNCCRFNPAEDRTQRLQTLSCDVQAGGARTDHMAKVGGGDATVSSSAATLHAFLVWDCSWCTHCCLMLVSLLVTMRLRAKHRCWYCAPLSAAWLPQTQTAGVLYMSHNMALHRFYASTPHHKAWWSSALKLSPTTLACGVPSVAATVSDQPCAYRMVATNQGPASNPPLAACCPMLTVWSTAGQTQATQLSRAGLRAGARVVADNEEMDAHSDSDNECVDATLCHDAVFQEVGRHVFAKRAAWGGGMHDGQ